MIGHEDAQPRSDQHCIRLAWQGMARIEGSKKSSHDQLDRHHWARITCIVRQTIWLNVDLT